MFGTTSASDEQETTPSLYSEGGRSRIKKGGNYERDNRDQHDA